MNAEQKIEGTARLLGRLDIAFRLARHAPAHTMEACEEVARSINALIPKNLLLCPRNESAFTLLIMRPETRFCTSLVSRRLESPRLGFANEGRMMEKLMAAPGAAGPLTLLIMRPETRFCTSLVSRRLESPRLGFANEGRMMEKLMAAPGAAGPLGLLLTGQRDVALALDERLKEAEELAFHPSENTASLAMSRRDFEEKLLPALGVPVRWISVEQEEIGC